MSEIIPTPQNTTLTPSAGRLDQNPAAVYLARLSDSGRRSMRHALDTMAGMMTGGKVEDCLQFPWWVMRYQHAAAIRAQLVPHYAAATVNKFLCALRGVLKEAWRLGLMTAEDYQRAADVESVTGVTVPAGRELVTGEIAALMAACEADRGPGGARDAAIVALLYGCGLRRQEVVALDLANLDQITGQLVILGKRNKQRTAYLINGAAEAMTDWLAVRGQQPGPLFYPIRRGGHLQPHRMTNQAIYKLLARRARQAGVSAFTPHDMRRTFVSDLLAAGEDIAIVAKMAGHANVQTTMRYDRRPEQAKRKAAGKLHVPYHRR